MNVIRLHRPSLWPRLVLAAAVVAVLGAAGAAHAGECPADKARHQWPAAPADAGGVIDVVLASSTWRRRRRRAAPPAPAPHDDRPRRHRAVHSHADRPALIMVPGEIYEYAASARPDPHKAATSRANTSAPALVEEHRHAPVDSDDRRHRQ